MKSGKIYAAEIDTTKILFKMEGYINSPKNVIRCIPLASNFYYGLPTLAYFYIEDLEHIWHVPKKNLPLYINLLHKHLHSRRY
jgi:hypothetical protein